jgi:hypothetical protein
MYGKRGFVQYQCALPTAEARSGIQALLESLAREGRSSFLSVLKRFGPAGSGLLSFPVEGYTLTLDLPVRDSALFPFLDRLDGIVGLVSGGDREREGDRQTDHQHNNDQPNDPVRDLEKGENLGRDLDEEPGRHRVDDAGAINVAPPKFGKKISRIHGQDCVAVQRSVIYLGCRCN